MSNITLTIPNDDHIALRAFGKALEEMALAHGAEPRKLNVEHACQQLESKDDYRKWYEEAIEASNEAGYMCMSAADVIKNMAGYISTLENYGSAMHKKAESYSIDTTAQQVESLATEQRFDETASFTEIADAAPTTDSTSTPWDERIHSASKALNADGTWRLRRKPKDMDETEWAALVESVKNELLDKENKDFEEWEKTKQPDYLPEPPVTLEDAVNASIEAVTPVMTDEEAKAFDDIEPPVTPPGDDFHTDTGVVTEQTVAGIPPIPVPPPVVVPPVTEDWTFPKLMTFLTERQGKIDVPTVNMLLAQDGIASLPELNAHPGKIGPFVARVKAHLGE